MNGPEKLGCLLGGVLVCVILLGVISITVGRYRECRAHDFSIIYCLK